MREAHGDRDTTEERKGNICSKLASRFRDRCATNKAKPRRFEESGVL
jgi:hypothetical protein